jgi:hypothetical protein
MYEFGEFICNKEDMMGIEIFGPKYVYLTMAHVLRIVELECLDDKGGGYTCVVP